MRRGRNFTVAAALVLLAAACSRPQTPSVRDTEMPRPIRDPGTGATAGGPASDQPTPLAADARSDRSRPAAGPLVVFLGDSLTAGLGLSVDEAYPAHVASLLAARGIEVRILNAGVSGDTSAGGLERLDWFLRRHPDVVVVELGANDGLRGQPLESLEANLRAIVRRSLEAGARVLLAGMRIPPNYGPEYSEGFAALYPRIAREENVALLPFLLEGVAAVPELNQPDGIHPNAEGQRLVAQNVAEALVPLLGEVDDRQEARAAR